jgi:hypothetical protein
METLGGHASPHSVSSAGVKFTYLSQTNDIKGHRATECRQDKSPEDKMSKRRNAKRSKCRKGHYGEWKLHKEDTCGKAIVLKRTHCPKDIIGKGTLY